MSIMATWRQLAPELELELELILPTAAAAPAAVDARVCLVRRQRDGIS